MHGHADGCEDANNVKADERSVHHGGTANGLRVIELAGIGRVPMPR